MFLKILISFTFFLISCGGNPLSQQGPVPIPQAAAPPQNTSSLTFSGRLNIRNNEIYRQLLQQAGICSENSYITGIAIGTSNCRNLEADPNIQLAFSNNKRNVQELRIYPQYERSWASPFGGSSLTPVILQAVDNIIYPINDSEGWEVRFSTRNSSLYPANPILRPPFEVRLRCEYCNVEENEFEEIDVYRGVFSDGVRFATISNITESTDGFPTPF